MNTVIFGITWANPVLGVSISTTIWAIEKIAPFIKEVWDETVEGLTRLKYTIEKGLYYPGKFSY